MRDERAKHPSRDPEASKKIKWTDFRGEGLTKMLHQADRWDDARSLLTILSAAVTADNNTSPRETQTLGAIIGRSQTFRRLSRDALDKLVVAVGKDLSENRVKAVEKATRSFAVSEDRQVSAYVYALDILLADRGLLPSEEIFSTELRAMLELAGSPEKENLAKQCDTLMKAKNWSGVPMSNNQSIEDRHKAFFTILAAAVLIDGDERKDEREELEALMSRTRTLSHFESTARVELREKVIKALSDNFKTDNTRWDEINWACDILNQLEEKDSAGICYSVFIHAIDLTYADRKVVESETRFLAQIESRLGLKNPPEGVTPKDPAKYNSGLARELIMQKNKY